MNQDRDHLRILSIVYYVSAALTGLAACIPLIHVAVGLFFIFGDMPMPVKQQGGPPFPKEVFGLFFVVIGSLVIFLGWIFALCNFLTGRYLANTRNYYFCLVMGALNCAHFPLGTILGVFTFIVLCRPSVKQLFLTGTHPDDPSIPPEKKMHWPE